MRYGRGGASLRSVCGGKIWVVGWVCGRGFCVCYFEVFLRYFYGNILGWVNGFDLRLSDGVYLGNL